MGSQKQKGAVENEALCLPDSHLMSSFSCGGIVIPGTTLLQDRPWRLLRRFLGAVVPCPWACSLPQHGQSRAVTSSWDGCVSLLPKT